MNLIGMHKVMKVIKKTLPRMKRDQHSLMKMEVNSVVNGKDN